jgi:hypothetical protein
MGTDTDMSELNVSEVLPECQQGFSDVRLAIGLIERDILSQTKITDKLSEAIEKIEAMNANLVKMLAVHELKHEMTCRDLETVEDQVDELRLNQSTTQTPEQVRVTKVLGQLEKWKYVLMGMVLALGWLLGHINWDVVLSILKFSR